MEKRDVVFLLALAGGGAYAAWHNWDAIAARLGLAEFEPGGIKAIQLAKNGFDFQPGTTNWQHLKTRADEGEIELPDKAWTSHSDGDNHFVVSVKWSEQGDMQMHRFSVDTITCLVHYQGPTSAAPR